MASAVVVVSGAVVVVVAFAVVDVASGSVVVVAVVDDVVASVVVVVVVATAVVVVAATVVVVATTSEPQNWMFEMSGVLPCPTFGRSVFANVPAVADGVSVAITAPGPPFTTMAAMASVAVQEPPVAVPFVIVTTDWDPVGFSKT